VDSEKNGQTAIAAFFDRLIDEAFARAAKGEPGKTPDQVLELMKVHETHMRNIASTFTREAELAEMISELDLESIEDPAIRRMNGKMAESLQAKLTTVEEIKAFTFRGYRDAKPEDSAPTGETPPPPSGP
jgi:hypothetical protein